MLPLWRWMSVTLPVQKDHMLTSVNLESSKVIPRSFGVILNLPFLMGVRSIDNNTSTMSPTRIVPGPIVFTLLFCYHVNRWLANCLTLVTHCVELASLARYMTTLSSLWKRSVLIEVASRPVGSTFSPSGTDSPWGSSSLYVKYQFLSTIAGYVV